MRCLRAFLVIFALTFAIEGQAKRGVTPEDYFAFENISDPHISPDGRQVAYVLGTVDQKRNRRVTSVWTVAISGPANPRRLTAEDVAAHGPRGLAGGW